MGRLQNTLCLLIAALVLGRFTIATAENPPPSESVHFDFETGDLQGWQLVEGKFDRLVSDRATYHNGGVYASKQGKYYLSTVEQQPDMPSNDSMTGTVESPVFVLGGAEMSLLVGGGDFPDAYVAICTLTGKEVLKARGQKTEVMQRVSWKAPELVGQKVFLRVVDHVTCGWGHITLDDFTAQGRVDADATTKRFAQAAEQAVRRQFEEKIQQFKPEPLRAAIVDLTKTFGNRYPKGSEFLARLDALEQRLAKRGSSETPAAVKSLAEEIEGLRREALVANPLVSGQPLIYVVRNQYKLGGHHAIDTLFHTGEINTACFQGPGALKTLDLRTGKSQTLVAAPEGIVRDPKVHFDGKKIVFALRRTFREDYHIWEVHADGTGLRQLTSAEGVCDFDPFYLADDNIAFSSTREPKYNQCSRDIGANLFRMEADGANIHQIGKNNLFDNHGTLLPDGRILYARWEYVDRNFGDAHGVWTVRPDGTNQAIYWGNNTASPGGIYYPRLIPGTQRLLCIFGMHHHRMWGALAMVDRQLGLDGREPVLRTWPPEAINMVRAAGPFDCDAFATVYPKYECPWPLSDKYFLCSRMTMRPGQTWIEGDALQGHEMGIYLLDVFGNEILLHVEGEGCYDPMPLAPQPRPPVLPQLRDFENKEGRFYVADVYRGTHMQGVQRGSVKSLRVIESPEKRHWSHGAWFGQGYTAPGMNWHSLENKRILGTVPVEEDGSVYFTVPAEKFVYFQLLDEKGMMVQSMRSGASVQSGETSACVGCHEHRLSAPRAASGAMPLALRREPSQLHGWHGPPREFGFMAEVQPVFDKHCVECHDYGKEAGKKLNLAADRTLTFNTAYTELWRKNYIHCIGAGPAEIQKPYSWGSHASKLARVLLTPGSAGHENLHLSSEELDRILTWMDCNGVYYPTYTSTYPNSLTGRIPLDNAQLDRLSRLTGVPFAQQNSFSSNQGPEVSFERPELSPCLTSLTDKSDPRYAEALAIIRAGKEMLAKHPREDMPNAIPCDVDQQREQKYEALREIELRNREAIRTGKKVFDHAAN